MWMYGPLFAMGLNQTLLFSFLPFIADGLSQVERAQDWGWLIVLLNLNLISYFWGSNAWPKKMDRAGTVTTARIVILGYAISNMVFIFALMFAVMNTHGDSLSDSVSDGIVLLVIGMARLAMGYYGSGFLPVAQIEILNRSLQDDTQYKQLSRLSGVLTVGRLLGPTLALLPLHWLVVMTLPLLPLVASFYRLSTRQISSHPALSGYQTIASNQTVSAHQTSCSAPSDAQTKTGLLQTDGPHLGTWQALQRLSPWAYVCALLSTAWVAGFQLALAPEIGQQFPDPDQASQQLAMLLVGVSVLVLLSQSVLMPILAAWIKFRLTVMACSLALFIGSLVMMPLGEMSFVVACTALAIAISGLPAWYSQTAFKQANADFSQSRVSGLLAQCHSLGHLTGTLLVALFLALGLSALHAAIGLACLLLLSMCTALYASQPISLNSTLNSKE